MNQENATEQYLQQLRNMGFNEDMIEVYRKQMTQYVNMANDWATQAQQQNSDALHNFLNTDVDGQPEAFTIHLNAVSDLTYEEKWAIACGADLAFANGQYLNDIATGLGKQACRQLLSDWWDIDSAEELVETIEWLQEEGHRLQYDTICQALNTISVKESKTFLRSYAVNNEEEEEAVMEKLRNTRDALELFREKQIIGSTEQPDALIWDFARIINLCRGGFDAGYLPKQQALQYIVHCIPAIKSTYSSWKELSVAYQFARCVWNGVDVDSVALFQEGMKTLLSSPESPWVALSWDAI
ncbi:Protein of unknown function [Filimonas lacunae]|uniref:DUF1266 domain-containing protein n=1 Tax=Filimonas lacunae TaxID=477680 RepID=A0A1N7QZW2_9BACT|nr:DUF1266 domain-containing protein [Filimonas lacunae]SIT28382.1 Protein of unknown function [Filimonas lacunae]